MTTIKGITITDSKLNILYNTNPPIPPPVEKGKLTPYEAANNIKSYLNTVKHYIGYEILDKGFGETKDDIINNFADSVYLLNTFINENNKIPCKKVAIYNYTKGHINLECERASYPSEQYGSLTELSSMFDSKDEELNKIELALILGNAWDESGGFGGLFNVCTQIVKGYPLSTCPYKGLSGYPDKYLVGRGLLQPSYAYNYIPITQILNKMNNLLKGKISPKYKKIIDGLPTDPIYPPLCGNKNSKGEYYKFCEDNINNIDCCQVPVTKAQIGKLCNYISNKEETIYTNPPTVCNTNRYPLSILSSLLYASGNTTIAVRKNNYSFRISACSINQGGFNYPIKADDYKFIETIGCQDGSSCTKLLEDNIKKTENEGCGLEGGDLRWIGMCKIMDLLFPNNNIKSDNRWTVKLKAGVYIGENADSRLYYN